MESEQDMEFDFTTLPPRDRYRLLIGAVVPRPIALVTTLDERGVPNAAPFSFFNVFSHDPVIVALGIEQRESGAPKDTVRNIRLHREFVVNLVNEAIAEAMNVCAVDFPPGVSELDAAGFTAAPSSAIKTPRIAESPVNMECRLIEELRFGGDGKRSIVLGEVVRFHIKDEFLTPRGYVDIPAMHPVGRLSGNGYVRLSDRFEMKRETYAEWLAHQKKDAAS
jgi:flavin reductase (DIM6/NTAB) family NADH-FMN oxidoreductase RutF